MAFYTETEIREIIKREIPGISHTDMMKIRYDLIYNNIELYKAIAIYKKRKVKKGEGQC